VLGKDGCRLMDDVRRILVTMGMTQRLTCRSGGINSSVAYMVPSHERIAMRALIAVAVLGLSLTAAQAGPCSEKIAQFEQAVRQSAGNPNAGPMARQTIGAQLDRQPTPASVKRAQERAQSTFAANLARAKRLDAQGNRAGCTRALAAAKRMYNF